MENNTIVSFIVSIIGKIIGGKGMLKEVKTSVHKPLYTLTEAEKIVDLRRARASRRRARLRIYLIKQHLCGLILIVLACLIPLVDNTAGMGAILCWVIGIGLLITRQPVMTFRR